MTRFLGRYRGAAIYEIEEFDSSEGQKLGSKVLAKAMTPDLKNMKVDFIEEGANQLDALDKIKKDIDQFLAEHEMETFVTDYL